MAANFRAESRRRTMDPSLFLDDGAKGVSGTASLSRRSRRVSMGAPPPFATSPATMEDDNNARLSPGFPQVDAQVDKAQVDAQVGSDKEQPRTTLGFLGWMGLTREPKSPDSAEKFRIGTPPKQKKSNETKTSSASSEFATGSDPSDELRFREQRELAERALPPSHSGASLTSEVSLPLYTPPATKTKSALDRLNLERTQKSLYAAHKDPTAAGPITRSHVALANLNPRTLSPRGDDDSFTFPQTSFGFFANACSSGGDIWTLDFWTLIAHSLGLRLVLLLDWLQNQVQQGAEGVRHLAFFGGVLMSLFYFLCCLNIFRILYDPFRYFMDLTFFTVGLGTAVWEISDETIQNWRSIQRYQSWICEYCKFMALPLCQGGFYVYIGTLQILLSNYVSMGAGLGKRIII